MIIKAVSGKKYRLASESERFSHRNSKAGTDKAYGYVGEYGSVTHLLILDLITLPNNETVVYRMNTYCGTQSRDGITVCNYDTAYVNCIRCSMKG